MASSRTALSATGSPGSVATVAPTEAPARLDGFITTREEVGYLLHTVTYHEVLSIAGLNRNLFCEAL